MSAASTLLTLAARESDPDKKSNYFTASRLAQLRADTLACTECDLRSTTTAPVPMLGSKSPWLLVGEAPGRGESEPFTGRSGAVINSVLKDVGWHRDRVAMTHLVCCAPPGGYDAAVKADAPARCRPLLDRTIDVVDPLVIMPMGSRALHSFPNQFTKNPPAKITEAVGQAWWWKGRLIAPNYHPFYIQSNPQMREPFKMVFHQIAEWIEGVKSLPERPKSYSPQWELAEISKGRHSTGEAVKMAEFYRKKGWVAVYSDVIDDRLVIAKWDAKVHPEYEDLPRYSLDEIAKLRGWTVGQFTAAHLAKKVFGAEVVDA